MVTHAGELYVQRRAGFDRDGLGSAAMGVRLPEVARQFLSEQHMLVVGGHDAAGAVWASPLYGRAGFIRADGERMILVGSAPRQGDPLYGALTPGSHVGAIAIEPATRRRMRINGTVRAGEGGLTIEADQIFANCPKYITPRSPEAVVAAAPEARRATELSTADIARITSADTFFIATGADGLGLDASHRGGEPGFVSVRDSRTLSWPEYRGNAMFMTLGNLHLRPECGLLLLDWSGAGPALHLTGRASIDWDPARIAACPGAERIVDFTVEQAVAVTGPALRWREI